MLHLKPLPWLAPVSASEAPVPSLRPRNVIPAWPKNGREREIEQKKIYIELCQWPFQDPNLEVPTIYKAYIRPM
jgi:hypothetical protein